MCQALLLLKQMAGLDGASLRYHHQPQRASAGLIISEATAITLQAQGYADVPGLYGTDTGRMCVAALNSKNIDYVCQAIAKVV